MNTHLRSDPVQADESSQRSWHVRLVSGAMAWSTWPLSERPLVVGRSLGCHINVDDNRVSRVQCEIVLEGGVPMLRHRSSRIPTLLNGESCSESALKLGDLIEFAGHRLIIDVSAFRPEEAPEDPSPTTERFDQSVYLQEARANAFEDDRGALASELFSLFALLRRLVQEASLESRLSLLRGHLAERLGPGNTWFAWRTGEDPELVFFPGLSTAQQDRPPMEILHSAMEGGEGVMMQAGSGGGFETLAAPLMHAGAAFGAIAVQRGKEHGAYALSHLHYLLAVAEGVAPLILGAERMEQLERDRERFESAAGGSRTILGSSEAMALLRKQISQSAKGRGNVMILGETGVGKELAARMIHDQSGRSAGPYVVINCAAIPETLFESEVFGHEEGAFSGASASRQGLFEQAHGGTLFLDEVGELSPTNQARLLRAVEGNAFRRVGGHLEICIDVRIVSATNRPLPDANGTHFRPDLFYRLSGYVVWLPPLRELPEDLPEIARHFLAEFGPHSPARPHDFSEAALESLQRYHWPGNVRELRNVVERACYTARERIITPLDLHLTVPDRIPDRAKGPGRLKDVERAHLLQVLKSNDGNVANAAKELGIAASTLYQKIRRYRISLRNPE